jgi:hypothetical protein
MANKTFVLIAAVVLALSFIWYIAPLPVDEKAAPQPMPTAVPAAPAVQPNSPPASHNAPPTSETTTAPVTPVPPAITPKQ